MLQVGPDPQKWPEDDILFVLAHLGHDTAGNYIIGEAAYRRHLEAMRQGQARVSEQDYPQLAAAAMQAGDAGSSAGGEFPKFTAYRELNGAGAHVIVKFSGNDHTPGVQRWSDLLVCEHLALQSIAGELGLPAARSRILRADSRTFLEVERFDRHGAARPSAPGRRWTPPCSAWREKTGARLGRACWPSAISRPPRTRASAAYGILAA